MFLIGVAAGVVVGVIYHAYLQSYVSRFLAFVKNLFTTGGAE